MHSPLSMPTISSSNPRSNPLFFHHPSTLSIILLFQTPKYWQIFGTSDWLKDASLSWLFFGVRFHSYRMVFTFIFREYLHVALINNDWALSWKRMKLYILHIIIILIYGNKVKSSIKDKSNVILTALNKLPKYVIKQYYKFTFRLNILQQNKECAIMHNIVQQFINFFLNNFIIKPHHVY